MDMDVAGIGWLGVIERLREGHCGSAGIYV
jgi:hypothetical protein